MLILFDIDATLINTSRSGILALQDAGRDLFGGGFSVERTDFAGRLDPLIIGDLLLHNDLPDTSEHRRALRDGYRTHIQRRLAVPGVGRALPGVQALLERLKVESGITLGLLTGNFPDTGVAKLKACGIDPGQFEIAIWGDQSPHDPPSRDHLPPLALRAFREHKGKELAAERATIIGDTPHDVRCALASGMRCLGVATGSFTVGALREAGAHHAVDDLSTTEAIVCWLLEGRAG